jgi:uncharacterized protein (DUF4213/DUF364 family)
MKILDDVLNSLDFNACVSDIRLGVFHSGVVSRGCGLASTLTRDAFKQDGPHIHQPGKLLEKTARELSELSKSDKLMEAAIGMAAINSLIQFDEAGCVAVNASEILAEKGKGKKVAIVGHIPFIPSLKEQVGWLWVIEKNVRDGDFKEHEADSILPQADVVGITGTSFTNHTIEHLLELCRKDAFVLMLGDTTPMSPVVFDYGIDAVCGVKVIDTESALKCVSQGANFRQISGVRLFTMFKNLAG